MNALARRRSKVVGLGLAASLLSLPLFAAPARAVPICNNGTDCRSELISDAQGMIAEIGRAHV